MTRQEAIYKALTKIGDKTSVKALMMESKRILGDYVSYAICVSARLTWRKEQGIEADCRTYQSQKRRNMLNDKKVPPVAMTELRDYTDGSELVLRDIVRRFHSIDQLRNALNIIRKENDFIDFDEAA